MKFPSLACVPKVHGAKFRFPTLLLYRNKSERMDIGTGSISLTLSLYLSFPLISCTTLNWYSNPSVTKTKQKLAFTRLFLPLSYTCVYLCIETINASPIRARSFSRFHFPSLLLPFRFCFCFFYKCHRP